MYKIKRNSNRIKQMFLLLVTFSSFGESYGQEYTTTVISGRIDDWIEGVNDTPEMVVYEKHQSKDYFKYKKSYKAVMKCDSFYISIVNTDSLFYAGFVNVFEVDKNKLGDAMYIVESGTNVRLYRDKEKRMHVETDNHLINSQINLMSNLNLLRNALLFDVNNGDRFRYFLSQMQEQRTRVDSILQSFSPVLSRFQHDLVRQNYVSYIDAMIWRQIGVMVRINKADPEEFSQNVYWMDSASEFMKNLPENAIVEASNTYLESQVNYNWVLGNIKAKIQGNPEDWFSQMYQSILTNYSGALRSKILVVAFKNFNMLLPNYELIEYIVDALNFTTDEKSRNELSILFETIQPGNKVQYFEFIMKDNSKVSIEDFAGKVVLAHFWSLGCIPCIEMTRNIEPLIEKYKNNPRIVFLNINTNASINYWVKGLKSNLYNHDKEILLNVGDRGISHPFLKYYNYISVPQLMIIDEEGNLVSSNAPRARDEAEFGELESMLIKTLEGN